jgi:PAS domain S-box-containing protein
VIGQNSSAVKATSDPLRYATLRRRTLVLGSLIIAGFVALGAFGVWRSYRHAITTTNRELGNVATALAGQTAWSWQNISLLLSNTASWYLLDSPQIPTSQLDTALRERIPNVRGVRRVAIVDSNGILRFSSPHASAGLDVSDRSYFTVHKDRTAEGLYLSAPLVSRTEHREAIVVSRRLEQPAGVFAGVVTALVELEDLKQFYAGVELGPGGAVQLLETDGTLLVRNPTLPGVVGQRFPLLVAAANASATTSTSRIANPIDHETDFVAVARVREAPLVVSVTREQAVTLQSWREEALRMAAGTLGVVLLGGFGIAAIVSQLRRVETGERALRQSEERYALALEGANEGHWDWEIGPDRLYLSPKLRLLHGLSAETSVDSRAEWQAQVPLHPDDAPRLQAAVEAHLAGQTKQYELEYRIRHPDGNWHWLLARGRCLRNERGEPERFVGSAIDISENKQAQAEKERLEQQLRQSQKMEAVGTLAGGIAHDFNNILGAIVGYGELAQQKAPEGTPLRRYLDSLMHAAERARTLVDRILGFSRSGAAEHVPVNVQEAVEEALELLRASLPQNVGLKAELKAANLAVIGDATRLHQVIMNLCTNAVQAMQPAGGTLSVGLERVNLEAPRTFSRGQLTQGSYLRFTVSDSGCGIPPELIDRIFEPFFTTKRLGEGTGLGLSLVHGIVADLHGVIDLDTAVGRGTTFSIWLPMSGEAASPVSELPRELPRGHGEAILVVDDEAPLVAVTEEMLSELGYHPLGVASGTTALQLFAADPRRFAAVLTDEMMPDLTGTQLAREIAALRPDVAVILMSGRTGDDTIQRAEAAGVRAVLRKPLQKKVLADALARALNARQKQTPDPDPPARLTARTTGVGNSGR